MEARTVDGEEPTDNDELSPGGPSNPDGQDPPGGSGEFSSFNGDRDPDDGNEPSHPLRHRMLEVLEDEPGLHKRGLRDVLEVGPEVFEYHLGKLEQAGEVRVEDGEETNQSVCFTRCQADLWADEEMRILWGRHPTRRVAAQLVDETPASTKELAEALDLTLAGVRHHLRKLRSRDLVTKERDGLQVEYTTSRKLEVWVAEHRSTIEGSLEPSDDEG